MIVLPSELTSQEQRHDHFGHQIERICAFLHEPRPKLIHRDLKQQAAVHNLKWPQKRIDANICSGEQEPLLCLDLGSLLVTLDRLFFNDNIFNGHIDMLFAWLQKSPSRVQGDTRVPNPPGKAVMRLHRLNNTHGVALINTMLHEMTHLLIDTALNDRAGCSSDRCLVVGHALNGHTGHAYWFQRLAAAIEHSSFKICGQQFDLGREQALWLETDADGEAPSLAFVKFLHEIKPFEVDSEEWTPEEIRDRMARCAKGAKGAKKHKSKGRSGPGEDDESPQLLKLHYDRAA